jgi:hypothetical protein
MRFLATQIRARFGEREEALKNARRQLRFAFVGQAKTADEELNDVRSGYGFSRFHSTNLSGGGSV